MAIDLDIYDHAIMNGIEATAYCYRAVGLTIQAYIQGLHRNIHALIITGSLGLVGCI